MTNLELFKSYHDPEITIELKAHRLKTLRDRANRGDSEAYRYARTIDISVK